MVAGRCSELRADILSIYEKNPICVTRDAMLCVGGETKREGGRGAERETEKKREKERGKREKRKEELEKERVGSGVRG